MTKLFTLWYKIFHIINNIIVLNNLLHSNFASYIFCSAKNKCRSLSMETYVSSYLYAVSFVYTFKSQIRLLGVHDWLFLISEGYKGIFFQTHNQKLRTLACHLAVECLQPSLGEILQALHAFTTSKVRTKKKASNLLSLFDCNMFLRCFKNNSWKFKNY